MGARAPTCAGALRADDPFSAASAVEWFNNKEWKGSTLAVSLAETKEGAHNPGGRGGFGRGGGRGGFG